MEVIHALKSEKPEILQKIAFIFILIGIPYFFIFLVLGLQLLSWMISGFIICYCLCVLANHYFFYKVASFGVIIIPCVAVFVYSSFLGEAAGIQFALLGITTLPFVLFSNYKIRYILLGVSIPIMTYISLELMSYDFFTTVIFSQSVLKNIYYFIILTTFIMIIVSLFSFLEENKKYSSKLVTAIDDIKQTNIVLEHAKEELTQVNKELARQSAYASLTKGIAHEIRNPLQMLYGRAELVLDNLDSTASVEKFASVVIRNVERLRLLLSSMLEYGTSSGEKKESFSITKIIDDISELSKHKCKENGITLTARYHEDIMVKGNRVFIYQALLNLVVNAIQYTGRRGNVTLVTQFKTYIDKQDIERKGVEIVVSDTGTGISKDLIKEIFVPYFTTKSSPENTGLGLSVALRTITENNGILEVESEEGVGSTFKVYLPLQGT
jgi:signal transduction histidine kinase